MPGSSLSLQEEQKLLRGILMELDTNQDGRVSWKEIAAALKAQGLHMARLRAIQAMLHSDHNGDGYIGEDEMKEFIKYVSDKWGIDLTSNGLTGKQLVNCVLANMKIKLTACMLMK
ncbi:hypothetical protein Dimus_026425 [Dionaea muscipula]